MDLGLLLYYLFCDFPSIFHLYVSPFLLPFGLLEHTLIFHFIFSIICFTVHIVLLNKIRNERGETTVDIIEIQRLIREYYEQLYANKLDSLKEMDKFLETCNILRLIHEEIKNLNRTIISNKIESVTKNSQ